MDSAWNSNHIMKMLTFHIILCRKFGRKTPSALEMALKVSAVVKHVFLKKAFKRTIFKISTERVMGVRSVNGKCFFVGNG